MASCSADIDCDKHHVCFDNVCSCSTDSIGFVGKYCNEYNLFGAALLFLKVVSMFLFLGTLLLTADVANRFLIFRKKSSREPTRSVFTHVVMQNSIYIVMTTLSGLAFCIVGFTQALRLENPVYSEDDGSKSYPIHKVLSTTFLILTICFLIVGNLNMSSMWLEIALSSKKLKKLSGGVSKEFTQRMYLIQIIILLAFVVPAVVGQFALTFAFMSISTLGVSFFYLYAGRQFLSMLKTMEIPKAEKGNGNKMKKSSSQNILKFGSLSRNYAKSDVSFSSEQQLSPSSPISSSSFIKGKEQQQFTVVDDAGQSDSNATTTVTNGPGSKAYAIRKTKNHIAKVVLTLFAISSILISYAILGSTKTKAPIMKPANIILELLAITIAINQIFLWWYTNRYCNSMKRQVLAEIRPNDNSLSASNHLSNSGRRNTTLLASKKSQPLMAVKVSVPEDVPKVPVNPSSSSSSSLPNGVNQNQMNDSPENTTSSQEDSPSLNKADPIFEVHPEWLDPIFATGVLISTMERQKQSEPPSSSRQNRSSVRSWISSLSQKSGNKARSKSPSFEPPFLRNESQGMVENVKIKTNNASTEEQHVESKFHVDV